MDVLMLREAGCRERLPHMDVLMLREAGCRERLPHMDVLMLREAGCRERPTASGRQLPPSSDSRRS